MAAKNSKKVKDSRVLAIDIGTRVIKAVELSYNNSVMRLHNVVVFPTPEESIDNNTVLDPIAIGKELRLRLSEAKVKTKRTYITLRGLSTVLVRPISMPRMTAKELKKAITFEVEQQVPFEPTDTVVDYAPIIPLEELTEDAENMKILLAAAKEDAIDSYLKILKVAKLVPYVMDVENLSAMRPLIDTYGENSTVKNTVVVLANIGASGTEINIVKNGNIAFTRMVPIGGDNFTNAISEEMGRTFEEAEELKRLYGKIYLEDIVAELPFPETLQLSDDNEGASLNAEDIFSGFNFDSSDDGSGTSFDFIPAETLNELVLNSVDEDEIIASSIFGDLENSSSQDGDFFSDETKDTGSSSMRDDGIKDGDDDDSDSGSVLDISNFMFNDDSSDDADGEGPMDLLSSMDNNDGDDEKPDNGVIFDVSGDTSEEIIIDSAADSQSDKFDGFIFNLDEPDDNKTVENLTDEKPVDLLSSMDKAEETIIPVLGQENMSLTEDNNVGEETISESTWSGDDNFSPTDLIFNSEEKVAPVSTFGEKTDDDSEADFETILLDTSNVSDDAAADLLLVPQITEDLLAQQKALSEAPTATAQGMNELFVRRIYESFTPVVEDLVKELRISLEYYSTIDPEIVSEIKLYGGTCLLPNLAEFISREIGVDTAVVNPFLDMDLKYCKQSDVYVDELAPMLVVATGLAMRDMITE